MQNQHAPLAMQTETLRRRRCPSAENALGRVTTHPIQVGEAQHCVRTQFLPGKIPQPPITASVSVRVLRAPFAVRLPSLSAVV